MPHSSTSAAGDADNGSTWTSWGATQPTLPASARRLLGDLLGTLTSQHPAPIEQAQLAPSRLSDTVREALEAAVGAAAVHTDDVTRARHAGGQSYSDLVRRRRGDASDAPDAVVRPANAREVAAVLRVCSAQRVAVVPWGGGTSVVGGLAALDGGLAAVVALDLSRMDRLLAVDPISRTATFEPGIRTPAAEAALAQHGLSLGHVPQSFERASLGGYVVTRSSGQGSSGRGRIDDMVLGLRMTTPVGELVLPAMPGSAAGPDLRRLVLGSEGTLGVLTEVTLRVRPIPATTHYEGWVVRSWEDGTRLVRTLVQDGPKPDVLRLSDEDETRISLALSGTSGAKKRAMDAWLRLRGASGGCLVIVGFEGPAADVRHRRRGIRRVMRAGHAVGLGTAAGKSWEHNRFSGPYLRDTLLDEGVLAETLETATTWSKLPGLYQGVREALTGALTRDGRPPLVGCHVSHVYPAGASLYFTVLAAASPGAELEQWAAAKSAANAAIVAADGTVTHHHAVGTAHRDAAVTDLGGAELVGVAALRAVKERLDPVGILNPGKLLPDGPG
ncbi:MAG TPA: FAD-binding oxidoreductase [Mycobacteriales bacterium]|nr:FAD-binding oxidoreductase [Mycobacteriales bacterium]